MHHYMPEIFYHDRKALLSTDLHPLQKNGRFRFVTSSVQTEVRIWEFEYEQVNLDVAPLAVNFVANLVGHNAAVNQVKFCQNPDFDLLASGDCHGRIAIWKLSDQPITSMPASDDFPPNKENWVRIKVLNHESDVTALCWSPCGKYIASVSNDDSLQVHDALSGKRQFCVSHLRHFPNGVSYDPQGKYIMTMSTDRKMDLIDAQKGTKLRSFGVAEFPEMTITDLAVEPKPYKLFHDDQLMVFQRGVCWSPCGQLIVVPCGRLEVGTTDIHCTLVFKRWELENRDRPSIVLPAAKPTFCIRFCPVIFQLDGESKENYSGLPYRVVWLALTKDSVIIYDSQHSNAIALVENISYNNLSDAAWSSDGKNVVISSMEGYIHYLKFNLSQLGVEAVQPLGECPESPHFGKKKAKKEKKEKKEAAPEEPKETAAASPVRTPSTKAVSSTPKSASLMRFWKPIGVSPLPSNPEAAAAPSASSSSEQPAKAKKRISVITIE